MSPEAIVSVVIPAYNGARYLAQAIESALAQTLPPHEIIVVDDGSTDATGEVARRYPIRYFQQENQGLASARNIGIAQTSGAFIALLDCDDIWAGTRLAEQVEALTREPDAGYALCYHRYFLETTDGQTDNRPAWFKRSMPAEAEPSYSPSGWLLRRRAWQEVGPFAPELRIAEDLDWLARANDLGVPYVMVPKLLLHKRVHETNLTGSPEIRQAMLRVLRASAARKRALGQS